MKLSKDFRRIEFQCSCGCGKNKPIDPKLLYLIQSLRNKIGKPIHITSGLRCRKYNRKIGGYIYSPHCLGKAVDIYVKNMDIITLAKEAKSIGFSRIGLYKYNGFIHVDVIREYRSSSWVRDIQGKYIYFKELEDAITLVESL